MSFKVYSSVYDLKSLRPDKRAPRRSITTEGCSFMTLRSERITCSALKSLQSLYLPFFHINHPFKSPLLMPFLQLVLP